MGEKVILMILDGWGISRDVRVSAIDLANTPFIDGLYKSYDNGVLFTEGHHVGLPLGQMGNSEVGHMNLGAGRIVYQDFALINKSIATGSLSENSVLRGAFRYAILKKKRVHFLGLLSDGGVHSHIDHLVALLGIASSYGVQDLFIHAFTDGRDVDPCSGVLFVKEIERIIAGTGAVLATLIGRYFAMDRDHRWERIKKAYDLLLKGKGLPSEDFVSSLKSSYSSGITDEFMEPLVKVDRQGKVVKSSILEGDVVLFFNFRTDRCRQLTMALSQEDYLDFEMQKCSCHYITMTNYDRKFKNVGVLFEKENIKNTLGEVLSFHNKRQVRVAETEKYPHVTFFFNGGREVPFAGEKRILCPSPKVATYDLRPQMSAFAVSDKIIAELSAASPDFVCLNFANPDMVGHTGNMYAAIKACEVVDTCVEKVIATALAQNYVILLIADHGNCEKMLNLDGSPNTSHTNYPVPIILIDNQKRKIANGILADIAPTILDLMGIEKPKEMTKTFVTIYKMIPKKIYQSWYTTQLPSRIAQRINSVKKLNPDYVHKIYTDAEIDTFVNSNFDGEIKKCYNRLNIIVAKVDFWRYLVLYKYGGVYLDMDSTILKPLKALIRDEDEAIITAEANPDLYVQWALIFKKGHPILERTIEMVIKNIRGNVYPNDIHKMTGPSVYSNAINEIHRERYKCDIAHRDIHKKTDITYFSKLFSYRLYGVDYYPYFKFKYRGAKLLYANKARWREEQKVKQLLI